MSSVEHGTSDVINTHAEGSVSFLGPKAWTKRLWFRSGPVVLILGIHAQGVEWVWGTVPFDPIPGLCWLCSRASAVPSGMLSEQEHMKPKHKAQHIQNIDSKK